MQPWVQYPIVEKLKNKKKVGGGKKSKAFTPWATLKKFRNTYTYH